MLKLSSDQIRQIWLEYFTKQHHLIITPKSLIPVNDPSLLWINSGVATLKAFFSSQTLPPAKRLCSCQRALRTNDIYNVGITARHHTFFEMLGNFSIGDYFKKEAITMAYDLLINYYKMDTNLLYITVFEQDPEAYDQWIKLGINSQHIIKGNRERNFWDLGSGPCGPCTEIFYDRGDKFDPNNIGIKLFQDDIENDRYVEIWNIVFSQFNNDGNGNLTELVNKNIDTGAGLERLASISQQTPTDFETDLFLPGIKSLQMHSKFRYESDAYFSQDANQQRINKDFKVIVDHVKACIFAIADGALPSNKERGYVLRRLLRRAFVCARRLELTNGYLTDLTNTTISTMNNFYDYLQTASPKLIKIMEQENFIFQETLARGMKLFTDFVTTQKIDDEIVFKLVDTYGIPFELVQELANTHHIKINEMAFNKRLVDQQTTSRAHFDAKGMISQNAQLIKFITPSEFDYANLSNKHAKVAACFNRDFKQVEQLQTTGWVVFDQTVFYATSGGQDHDTGYVIFNDSKLEIIDVVKGPNGQHLHLINNLHSLSITKGDKFSLFVDKSHRLATSRNHTTEHLLQQALQTVIDPNIKQEGAFKSATKLTYDFHFHEKLSSNQLIKIQDQVNEYIKQAMPVTVTFASLEEAQNKGAKAYFVDVYKKIKGKLRLVDIHGNSLEICGGTHVTNTSDIEEFLITKLISIGSGSWRIEGITSKKTIQNFYDELFNNYQNKITQMKHKLQELKISDQTFEKCVARLSYFPTTSAMHDLKHNFEMVQELYDKLIIDHSKYLFQSDIDIVKNTKPIVSQSKKLQILVVENVNNKAINQFLGQENVNNSQAIVILNKLNNKLQYFSISNSANQDLSAKEIVNEINKISHGKGGGKTYYAQGGSDDVNLLSDILSYLKGL